MFRRLSDTLPEDPVYPENLEELGYFVTEDDKIRSIKDPTKEFNYFINRNARYNEMHGGAMNACIRNIVVERLHKEGLVTIRLPIGAGPQEPHVPILVSQDLKTRKRVVVIFNHHVQELGVWALRKISKDTISNGSAIKLVRYLQKTKNGHRRSECPGVILANPGQLLWYRKGKRAISHAQRNTLPRKSAVHPAVTMASEKNLIPQNRDPEEHVAYVMSHVVALLCHKEAKLNIVAVADAGANIVNYLDKNWESGERLEERLTAIVFTEPQFELNEVKEDSLNWFLTRRSQIYVMSSRETASRLVEETRAMQLNVYSSGEKEFSECIMPRLWKLIVDFFQAVEDNPEYVLPDPCPEAEYPDTVDPVGGPNGGPDGGRDGGRDGVGGGAVGGDGVANGSDANGGNTEEADDDGQ